MIKKDNQNILRRYNNELCLDFAVDFYRTAYLTRFQRLRYNFYHKLCYLEFIIHYILK